MLAVTVVVLFVPKYSVKVMLLQSLGVLVINGNSADEDVVGGVVVDGVSGGSSMNENEKDVPVTLV